MQSIEVANLAPDFPEITPEIREDARRLVEALHLGEAFDQFRDAATDEDREIFGAVIADALVEACGWDEHIDNDSIAAINASVLRKYN
jgi:hypothetical protein